MGSLDYDPNADPLDNIARGLHAIARSIHCLGTADAATPMGAIETLGLAIKEAVAGLGSANKTAAETIANAIETAAMKDE